MSTAKTGLYREAYEKDSCGFGLIASLDDAPSHWLVKTAIASLNRLTHRGAIAADGKTGDGCGLLLKKPDKFLRVAAKEAGIKLAPVFAAGNVFLNTDPALAARAREELAGQLKREGLQVAGWRALPTDPSVCGAEALKTLPAMEQLFVNAPADMDAAEFNRKLFMTRRRAEKALAGDAMFYLPSLSSATIVYKGMVMPTHLAEFYPDLADPRVESSVALFHQRFSTNTLPQWGLAHPFRMLAHNGEINTVEANRNWAVARGSVLKTPLLPDLTDILPLVSLHGSDSQSLDNMLEVLVMGGLDVLHALRLLVPPAWGSVDAIDPDLRAYYEFYGAHMEPWDGPAGLVVTDGRYAVCTTDRNGLRPARYVITKNRHLTVASEIGVWDYRPEDVVRKGRMGPGQMLALDLSTGTLLENSDIDELLKERHPYKAWLKKGIRHLHADLVDPSLAAEPFDRETLAVYQKMFNLTAEEREEVVRVLARDESEAIGSMGDDTPTPVLSHHLRNLYDYFRQQFAQVTNPPIDPLRESIVMSLQTQLGPGCNVFQPVPEHAQQLVLNSPVLSQRELRQVVTDDTVPHALIDLQFDPAEGLKNALQRLCREAEAHVRDGVLVLLISDRYLVKGKLPVHALLATGAIHHHLVRLGIRFKCNLVIETGTARDPHHFACLIGYGATAVYPFLAFQTLYDMMRKDRVRIEHTEQLQLGKSYRKGIAKGLFKIMSKMGISTIASYRSGQLFEIVGLSSEVVDMCFHGTTSRIEGTDLRGPADRRRVHRAACLEQHLFHRTGRIAQVRVRRRVPHVQPGRHRLIAGRGGFRQPGHVPGVRAAGQRQAGIRAARPAAGQGGRRAGAAGGSRTGRGHPEAVRLRGHVAGRVVAGGARGAGHRDEPARRPLQLRRGWRGSGALRHREELQDQAGGFGPLRRDAALPGQCRSAADQDRAGRQARRGRPAARRQGQRDDRAVALRAARRRPDLAAAASRHLFDRGSGAADLRPQAGQSAGAGVGEAGLRARRRHDRRGRGQGLCGPDHHLRLRRRHRRQPDDLHQVRRLAMGAGAGRDAPDTAAQRPARQGAPADRRRPEDRPGRDQGGGAGRRELRLRHRADGRAGLQVPAHLPPEQLRHRAWRPSTRCCARSTSSACRRW